MREKDSACDDGGDRLRRGSNHRHGIRRRCAVGRASNDDTLEGMADLRPRSRRHALFAADSNHAGQCRPARGGVGVSHEARGRAGAGRPAGRSRCRRSGTWTWRSGTRRLGLQLERGHAARRQRDDVSSRRRTTGSSQWIRRTGKEIWAFRLPVRKSFDPRRRVLARRRADAAADRLRLERRQAVFARRQDRNAQ